MIVEAHRVDRDGGQAVPMGKPLRLRRDGAKLAGWVKITAEHGDNVLDATRHAGFVRETYWDEAGQLCRLSEFTSVTGLYEFFMLAERQALYVARVG